MSAKHEQVFTSYDPAVGPVVEHYPVSDPRLCGWSHCFICSTCGDTYARIKSFVENRLQPFRATIGRCYLCPGDRYTPPGTIETLSFVGWHLEPLARYQARIELAFLDSVHHPNYKELSPCLLTSNHLSPSPA